MKYAVVYEKTPTNYSAYVPDLPGCSAWGVTPEEAVREVQDAQQAWIEACQKSGEPVPQPSTKGRRAA